MCFTYFSYKTDYLLLKNSIQSLKFWFPHSKIFVVDDHHNPMETKQVKHIEFLGGSYRRSTFKRNGNLNGEECICGILDELKKSATISGASTSFKVDSDLFMFNSKAKEKILKERKPAVFLSRENGESGFGLFYGLPSSRINDIKENFLSKSNDAERLPKTAQDNLHLPEDICITYSCYEIIGKENITQLTQQERMFSGWIGKSKKGLQDYSQFSILHFGQKGFGSFHDILNDMNLALKLITKKRAGL